MEHSKTEVTAWALEEPVPFVGHKILGLIVQAPRQARRLFMLKITFEWHVEKAPCQTDQNAWK
jgi:hypothetical protein